MVESNRTYYYYLTTLLSFAVGSLCSISSLAGFLDDRVTYCDSRTNPCTEYTISSHQARKLQSVKSVTVIPGAKNKLLLALIATPFFALSWYTSGIIQKISFAEAKKAQLREQILSEELQNKEAFLSSVRFAKLRQQIGEKMAELDVLRNPELVNNYSGQTEQDSTPSVAPEDYQDHRTPQRANETTPSDTPPPSNPQTHKPGSNPRFDKYYGIGETALKSMTYARRSIILASSPGTGKSTTEKEWIRRIRLEYPETEFYALTQKADSLCGLYEEGRVWIYNQGDVPGCLEPIDIVFNELTIRRSVLEGEERKAFDNKPIRLILGDWFATYNDLLNTNKKICSEYCSKLGQIITVGREFNVALFCDTQSINMASLGITDTNIRLALEIYAQGFKNPMRGVADEGDYNTMRNAIRNQYICDPKYSGALVAEIDKLAAAIANGDVNSPLIFLANMHPPQIGLVPDLSKSDEPRKSPPVVEKISPVAQEDHLDSPVALELPVVPMQDPKEFLENIWQLEKTYTPNKLSKEELVSAINQLLPLLGLERTISTLWMVQDPTSEQWKRAVVEYEQVFKS